MEAQKQPLTNLQLELLKVFAHQLSDEDLKEVKQLLADFFAQKAIAEANKVWDAESWDKAKIQEILNTKLRTPYKS